MDFSTEATLAFLTRHQEWSFWLALVFAAAETTAFLSLAVPSTAILVGVGALVATGAIPFLPIWAGAALGAILGSTFSWWLGWRYGDKILTMWPLKDHPDLVDRAAGTFRKWGVGAVFLGHFIGPLRPVIFLFAGMMKMGFPVFMAVNVASALAWAWLIPKLGEVSGLAFGWTWNALGL
jgi:membrane protein DedA with SNARE-associated domain